MKNHHGHHTQLHPSPTRSSQNCSPSTRRRRSSSLSSIGNNDHGGGKGFRSEGEMEYVRAAGERRIKKRCRKHVALSSSSTTLGAPFTYQIPTTTNNALAPSFAFPSLPSEFRLPTSTTRPLPGSTSTTPSTPPSFSPSLFPSSSSYSSDPSSHSPVTPPTHATAFAFRPLSSPTPPSPLLLAPSYAMDLDGPPELELNEIRRLHQAAFDDLRKTTQRDGDGFVERLQRWENERVNQGVGLGLVRAGEEMGGDAEWRDEELDVNFELGDEQEAEMGEENVVDRLALQLGGEELEDYAAVREYQKVC